MDRIFGYILTTALATTWFLFLLLIANHNQLKNDFNRLNKSFTSLNTSFNQVSAQAEAQKIDIEEIQAQDRQDYEALEKSCKVQIKQAVEATLKTKPNCKTGVTLYGLDGVVK